MNKIEQTVRSVFATNEILRKNLGQELLLISKDKLKNKINDFKNSFDKKDEWKIYLGMVSTLGITLITSEFKSFFGIKAENWKFLFIAIFLYAIIKLSLSLFFKMIREKDISFEIDRFIQSMEYKPDLKVHHKELKLHDVTKNIIDMRLNIVIPPQTLRSKLMELKKILEKNAGDKTVRLYFSADNKSIEAKQKVNITDEFLGQLESLFDKKLYYWSAMALVLCVLNNSSVLIH